MKRLHLVTICLLMCSCSPRIIENVRVERDTTYISNHVRDSIYFRDSIYVKEYVMGDTVKITEYRERWRDRFKEIHDTLYKEKIDSVRIAVPVEFEKKLSAGKNLRLSMFFPLLCLAVIGWRREILEIVRKALHFFL